MQEVATCADDEWLRVYRTSSHKLLVQRKLPMAARAAAYSPDGAKLAVGLRGTAFQVLNAARGMRGFPFSNQ